MKIPNSRGNHVISLTINAGIHLKFKTLSILFILLELTQN